MKTLIPMLLMLAGLSGAATLPAPPVENLTLDQALAMADSLQPQIAEARAMVEAAAGRARQAGAFPNPEAIVGAQQLGGANSDEYVAGVAQAIPLGQRLGKAREAELLEKEVRARGLQVKRREIHRRVHGAFATALYQERALQTQQEIHANAGQAARITQARVKAGDAVREDLARVEIELARAQVELRRAESLRDQARLALAAAMGNPALPVNSLAGTLDAAFEIPTLETLAANLAAQPESLQAEADVRARNAWIDLVQAERIPDVKVEVLYHRLQASRENTVDLGLNIPLPLFNRNEGRLREARAEAAAAEARARLTRDDLATRLRESHLQLTAALANSRALKEAILPKAETVRQGAEKRYAAGDISLAEILPVRREWAAVQLSYLETLRDVMLAWGEVRSFQ